MAQWRRLMNADLVGMRLIYVSQTPHGSLPSSLSCVPNMTGHPDDATDRDRNQPRRSQAGPHADARVLPDGGGEGCPSASWRT
jgi:hypothetical protein